MVYIEIRTFQGKKYKYLRRSIRVEGKMKKVTLKCIGPVEPIYRVGKKRKSNAFVYVKPLMDKEKTELHKALKSTNAFTRDRARIILLSSEKISPSEIANKISCEVRKTRFAVKAFNQEGLKALERKKAKGAVPKFTEWDKKSILIHFSKGPREFGYHYTTWTLPRFRNHLTESNVVDSICIETIRQIILGAGARLTKSKRWQYSPDKNFLKRKEQ